MEDFGDTKTQKMAEMATSAFVDLDKQLIELPVKAITQETAPFIAGLLLARQVENSLLDAIEVYSEDSDLADADKEYVGSYMSQLAEAQKGNFLPLKEFIKEREKASRDPLSEYKKGSKDYKELLMKAQRFQLLNTLIPPIGSGTHIKLPNPAHMEAPVPLKIQLERFKAGGEIRQ